MIGVIFRALARSATAAVKSVGKGAEKGGAAVKRTPQGVVRKPNKLIRLRALASGAKRPALAGRQPSAVHSAARVQLPGRSPVPAGDVDVSNRMPPDRTHADVYHRVQVPEKSNVLTPKDDDVDPKKTSDEHADTTARLLAGLGIMQGLASSFIPSIVWSAAVSARGFKSTPLRTVLHYCLSVAFGMVHQQRLGSTQLKVDLYPNENRVEVHFTSSSSLLLEPVNIAFNTLGTVLDKVVDGVRDVGKGNPLTAGISFVTNLAKDPVGGVTDFIKFVGDQIRLAGPGGIWDMAKSNYYGGVSPATMILNETEPFTSMRKWAEIDKRPMLTRSLADNPQGEHVPDMHYPTFFDLRSLVAQALHDPGVLPPPPDTFVALPDAVLP